MGSKTFRTSPRIRDDYRLTDGLSSLTGSVRTCVCGTSVYPQQRITICTAKRFRRPHQWKKSVLGLLKYMSSFSKNRDREASGSRRQWLLSTYFEWSYLSGWRLREDITAVSHLDRCSCGSLKRFEFCRTSARNWFLVLSDN